MAIITRPQLRKWFGKGKYLSLIHIFWVNLPVALYGKVDLAQVTGVVNTYKLASKRFSINFI